MVLSRNFWMVQALQAAEAIGLIVEDKQTCHTKK